ncbi:MAG: LacI family DNA-binding transcriptional regulator [bacterium]
MATITDVSNRAKVSRSTVSRIIAGNGYVSDAARAAVDLAIAELGYRPNQMARGLRSNRSGIIGAVVGDIAAPFYAQMVGGMQTRCRKGQKNILVASGYANVADETRAILELIDRSCDGLILYLENPVTEKANTIIAQTQVPVVVIGGSACSAAQGTVRIDNFAGARDGMRYLLAKGHRKIAYFAGNMEFHDTRERLLGIEAAMVEAGLMWNDLYLDRGEYSADFGQAAANRLLASDYPVTAIFAGDDDIAAGALLAIRAHGMQAPRDISILGFDDNFHARHLTPSLTTVRQPIDLAGELAADLLLAIIGDTKPETTDIQIKTELLQRDSVRDLMP